MSMAGMMADARAGTGNAMPGPMEVDSAECDCCGLTEECTLMYIQTIRERYGGKWICGLCAEAVKEEVLRCNQKLLSPDEAMARHLSFCSSFRASGPPMEDCSLRLIRALSRVLRRGLEGPKSVSGSPTGRGGVLTRSESCVSKFNRGRGIGEY